MNTTQLVFAVYDKQGFLVKVDPTAWTDMLGQAELATRMCGTLVASNVRAGWNYVPPVARRL